MKKILDDKNKEDIKELLDGIKHIFYNWYKACRDEIKENGFKISLGIATIILGIFSVRFNSSNIIIIGISISSFLISIIDVFCSKNSIFYTIPLSILLIFCVFPNDIEKISIFKPLLEPKLNDMIVYISFGLFFLFNSISGIKNRYNNIISNIENNQRYMKMSNDQLQNCVIINQKIYKLLEVLYKKEINDKELNEVVNEIRKYADEEEFISHIRFNLAKKGLNNNINKFNIEEIEKVIVQESNFTRKNLDKETNDILSRNIIENKE